MKEQQFKIVVNAPAAIIWEILWNENTYMQWASAFCMGSYAKSDWKLGSKVLFLSPDGTGIYSEIAVLEPDKTMVFKHIGEIKNDKEYPKNLEWTGSEERYTLTESNGQTTLSVTMDLLEQYISYFNEAFPKALAIVKEMSEKNCITVATSVKASMEKVWNYWTLPEHIIQWNNASDDWHTTKSTNDLKEGGKFSATMAAKDGSMSFDFEGRYTEVKPNEKIRYEMDDGRKATILFCSIDGQIKIVESFEPENQNSLELQHDGWQSILDNFKKYIENK